MIGGGPGGLYAAALLKAGDPSREVAVYERNRADDTFGFGVVFSSRTLQTLAAEDPQLHAQILSLAARWEKIEIRIRGQRIDCGGQGFAGIGRMRLLKMLQERCVRLGVQLRFQTEAAVKKVAGFDLVVAADGANSGARQALADRLGPSYHLASAKFIWFGTTAPFEALTFLFEKTEHGWFAVHAYPYDSAAKSSTFIVETSEATWRAAGLDRFDTAQPPGVSDLHSKAYIEHIFRGHLRGHGLLVNNSRWGSFRTIRCSRWVSDNIALLGDAVHTAHFSVGSGTKMAMEDALALSRSVDSASEVRRGLGDYEEARKPDVARIQSAARPSLSWWEHFGQYADAYGPGQFAFHFLTRSGHISRSNLAGRDERFVKRVESWFAEQAGEPRNLDERIIPPGQARQMAEAIIEAPAVEGDLVDAIQQLTQAVKRGAHTIAIRQAEGGLDSGSLLCARLLAEHARLELGARVVFLDPRMTREAAETMILSGRADFVGLAAIDSDRGRAESQPVSDAEASAQSVEGER